MPDTGMFGAPIGFRQAEIDQQQAIRTLLEAQKTLGEIAMQPQEMRLKEAHGRYYNAQAAEHEAKARDEAQMQELAKRAAQEVVQGTSVIDQADRLAQSAIGQGKYQQALDITGKTSLVRQHVASADASVARSAYNRFKTQADQAAKFAATLEGVTDEATWAAANQLFSMETGQPSPWAALRYNPQMVQNLQAAQLSVKDKAELGMKEVQQESLESFRRRRLAQHDTTNALSAGRLNISRHREERLSKEGGGKEIAGPSKTGIAQASRLIKQDFPALGESAEELTTAASAVASTARRLMRANKALDEETAIQQAYAQERRDGSFQVEKGGWFSSDKTKFQGAGKTPETPMALPLVGGAPDAAKMIKGRWYASKDGTRVGQWNGSGLANVQVMKGTGRPLSSNNSRPSPAPADETDDEED